MDGLDFLWAIGCAVCAAFMAYGAWLCACAGAPSAEDPVGEVNSSHASSAPGHIAG
jgi:hypothetical protein